MRKLNSSTYNKIIRIKVFKVEKLELVITIKKLIHI